MTWQNDTKLEKRCLLTGAARAVVMGTAFAAPAAMILSFGPEGGSEAQAGQAIPASEPAGYIGGDSALDEGVVHRARDGYNPLGIDIGGDSRDPGSPFTLYPSAELTLGYDDNVFKTDENRQGDFFFSPAAQLLLRANTDPHAFEIGVRGSGNIHFDETNNDSYAASTFSNFGLQITDDFKISGGGDAGINYEERSNPGAIFSDVSHFFETGGYLAAELTPGDFLFRTTYSLNYIDYFDNNNISLNERNLLVNQVDGRVGYKISPLTTIFVAGSYNWRNYVNGTGAVIPGGVVLDRDSEGWNVSGGINYELTGVVFLDARAGYHEQSYDHGPFKTQNGFFYEVGMTWNPTDLLTVRLEGGQRIEETTISGAAGENVYYGAVNFDYEFRDNVLFTTGFRYENSDFIDLNRTDQYYIANAGVRYLVNEYMELSLDYRFSARDSDVANTDFYANRVWFTLALHI